MTLVRNEVPQLRKKKAKFYITECTWMPQAKVFAGRRMEADRRAAPAGFSFKARKVEL